jgi:hypothetical protein
MTNNEVFTLSISGLSLLVSVISVILASKANAKANTLSQERNELALRQAKASEHAMFVQSLMTVNQRLKDLLREFSQEAEEAFNRISDIFDTYDKQKNRARRLGDIYSLFCDLIYAALSFQLVWSTNIHDRLLVLWRDIDHDREDNHSLVQMLNWMMYKNPFPSRKGIFKWLHHRPPVEAKMLAKGIHEIHERVEETKEIFLKGYDYLQKYFELFEKLRPVLEDSIEELNRLLEMDKHREFKLYESYSLYQEYMETITKLEFLSECGMWAVKHRYDFMKDKFWEHVQLKGDLIGYLLYMGVILSIIRHYSIWGTDPVTARNMFGSL